MQRLQPYINAVADITNMEAAQKTLDAAKTLGSSAIASSKQVLETAKEYGLQALESAQSLGEHLRAADEEHCTLHPGRRPMARVCQTAEPPRAFLELQQREIAPRVEAALVRDGAPEDVQLSAASAPEQHKQVHFDLPLPPPPPPPFKHRSAEAATPQHRHRITYRSRTAEFGGSDMQQGLHRTQTAEFGRVDVHQAECRTQALDLGRLDEQSGAPTTWRFDAGDGLHLDIRATPGLRAMRTGKHLLPGEEFQVSEELHVQTGVLFLRLADGRGWVFDKKPGVGRMCFRTSAEA